MATFDNRWTEQDIQRLKELWIDTSASVIGKELGKSRNAVIGKAHRLKLGAKEPPIIHNRENPVRRREKRQLTAPKLISLPQLPSLSAEADPLPAPIQSPPPATAKGPCTLMELEDGFCRWPVSDTLFCGAKIIDRLPYCADHARTSYSQSRTKRPKIVQAGRHWQGHR